ncbi:MAG: YihY/virulence factor BrkB family protein [Raoultibacter sp.]
MKERALIIAKELLAIWDESTVKLLPAHLAFFSVLSIAPVLIILFFAAQYFSLPIEKLLSPLESSLPDAILALFAPTEQKASTMSVGIWLIVALFIGSNGLNSLITGSDSLYGFEGPNVIAKRLKAVLLTLILVIIVLFGVAIIALSEYLIGFISGDMQGFIAALRWVLLIILAFTGVKFAYMTAVSKRIPSRDTNKGTLVTICGWIIAFAMYGFYYANFSNYNELYGALANIIVLMILAYILSTIFVIGMIVNVYQYRKYSASP